MFVHSALARVPLVFDTLVTLLLFIVGAALGRRLLRGLRVEIDEALERGFFAAALGMGALTYLPFALFALGIGYPPVVVGAALLLAVALLPEEARIVRGAWRGLTTSVREWRQRGPAWTWVLGIALAPLLLVTFLQALCPPTDPDGLSYHLTAPLRYLNAGRFFYMPTFLHVHWPLSIEMLFGLGLAFNAHYAASMVQFGLGLLLLLGTYALGRRIASPAVGWLAAALLFAFLRGQMTMAYIDLGLALLTLASVFAFFRGWQGLQTASPAREAWGVAAPEPDADAWRRWWRLSAILAGLTATTKLPGILTVGVLAAFVFLTLWGVGATQAAGQGRLRFALQPAVGYLAVGLLVVAPWFLRCWALTHDPFFPYFWLVFGARDWDAAAHQRLNEYFQMFNTLRTWNPTPERVVRARAIACLGLAVIGAALGFWRATRPVRPLLAFLFTTAFLQVATSGIYIRYFLPLFAFAILMLLWALRQPLARSAGVAWAIALLIALRLWGPNVPRIVRGTLADGREGLRVALGSVSRDAYLERLPIYPTLRWANANLPPDATLILGVWDPYAALVERSTLTTNVWVQNALRFDSLPHLLDDVRRLHATHLLLHYDPPPPPGAFVNKEDSLRKQTEMALLETLARQYGTPLYSQNGYTLYALRLPPSG